MDIFALLDHAQPTTMAAFAVVALFLGLMGGLAFRQQRRSSDARRD